MNQSAISWTTVTWNPTHGCTRVSEGCRNCYAESLSLKRGWTKKPWTKQNEAENVLLKRHKLRDPYRLKEPSRVFVNSMSDLFHPLIPDDYRRQIFAVMRDLPQHTFQILTKRPELAAQWPEEEWADNMWMGTSVEDARVIHRLDALRECHAKTLFISAEPLIGPWPANVNLFGYHWLIVGGESGKDHRPMPHAWARHLRDLCIDQSVSYYFKQSAAFRTEIGTSLSHGDGTFWNWHQWPHAKDAPTPAPPHKYTDEPSHQSSLFSTTA